LLNADGSVREWVGCDADVHEQKMAEEALRQANERMAADLDAMTRLQRVGSLFAQDRNLEEVLGEVVEAAMAISGADFGNIQLMRAGESQLRIAAQRGFPQWWVDFWQEVSAGHGCCGNALARPERVIVEALKPAELRGDTCPGDSTAGRRASGAIHAAGYPGGEVGGDVLDTL
jgi:GAF domain-containing protein